MEELEVPSEFTVAISRMYRKVICCVCIGARLSEIFNSTIGVTQGCPVSPSLFGLCIEELEEMVTKLKKTLKKLSLGLYSLWFFYM